MTYINLRIVNKQEIDNFQLNNYNIKFFLQLNCKGKVLCIVYWTAIGIGMKEMESINYLLVQLKLWMRISCMGPIKTLDWLLGL